MLAAVRALTLLDKKRKREGSEIKDITADVIKEGRI